MGEDAKLSEADLAELKSYREQHQKNRESLLSNEGFAISMQQVVAGGLLLALLSKWDELIGSFGPLQVAVAVTMAAIGLIAAVLAAQLRHDYRMWDVKATASAAIGRADEARIRGARTNTYLVLMRVAMWTSTAFIVISVLMIMAGVLRIAVIAGAPN